ncbi:MAG: D-alanyl transfer protein [Bacteroidetes bacterium]|nr:D-alanyl transfer protein [Bacteroidota bacterium]
MSFRILQVYLDAKPSDKPVYLLRYVSFYTPTLLIGPIDRFHRFNRDLDEGYRRLCPFRFTEGLQALLYGLLYKYIIAECINRYWLNSFDPSLKEWFPMVNNMYGYFIYLFFDFAGYSHMAIGMAKMSGIDVPQNFKFPFLARNPQDFWRRFHITLGDWLKDYFFKPFYLFLSGKKVFQPYPLLRQNIALFFTFTLMGCWNGFKLWFILSGMLFGIYSLTYNSYQYHSKKKRRDVVFGKMNDKYVKWISIIIMFNLAAFSIYIFSGRFPFIN